MRTLSQSGALGMVLDLSILPLASIVKLTFVHFAGQQLAVNDDSVNPLSRATKGQEGTFQEQCSERDNGGSEHR